MFEGKEQKEKERILRIAYEALEECNKLHISTGCNKIPLDDIAENLAINKEEIQNSFDQLVQEGVLGDDSDRDHLNYINGDLRELILELLLALIERSVDKKEDEEEVKPYLE